MMTCILILLAAAAGGFWRRCLGGWLSPPRWLAVACGAAWAYLMAILCGADLVAAGLIAAALIWAPGHGCYQDMGLGPDPDNEWLRFALRPLFPVAWRDGPLYDMAGMALLYTMMAAAAVPGLLLAGSGSGSAWLLLTGPAVAVAYFAGSRLPGWGGLPGSSVLIWGPVDGYTSAGEIFSGAIRWGGCAAILLLTA